MELGMKPACHDEISAMPTVSSSSSSFRRPRRLLSTTVVALLLSSGVTPSQCFQQVSGLSVVESRTATRRFFRNTADSTVLSAEALLAQNPLLVTPVHPLPSPPPPQHYEPDHDHYNSHSSQHLQLPTWLADPKDGLWESNWYALEEAMLSSFFTPMETQRLLQTIETAARGDRHQMASAAEFCLILVEQMEMGLSALMAAAVHVCACVTARQYPHHEHTCHVIEEGHDDQASLIARDAGRLKKLEMVAAMIYSQKSASRVTPNAQDAEHLRSLLLTETKDWRALAIRTAAALYRLRGILGHALKEQRGVGAREMNVLSAEARQCSREALYIYAPLASRLGMHRLKNELEGAAFRILYRRQYETVNRLARELRPRHSKPHLNRGLVEMCDSSLDISSCMKSVLDSVKTDMTQLLHADPYFSQHVADFSVTARVKEPYSLWKKMLRNKCQHIMEVPDVIALRIVLEAKTTDEEDEASRQAKEVQLCYYAQQLCMQIWQPVADNPRFKDYIECPKPNGYQSLHYTAHTMWDEEDWHLEIQVRSGEMHQVAEFGLASHWDYKANQKSQQEATNDNTNSNINHDSNEYYYQEYYEQQPDKNEVHYEQQKSVSDDYLRWVHQQQQQHELPLEDFGQQHVTSSSLEASERADRIRARTKKLQPYIEALTAAQSDLAREHVFVFLTTPGAEQGDDSPGTVLALPSGSVVLDALRQGEQQLGITMPDVIGLNGEWSDKLTSKLQNGDILTVPMLGYPYPQQQTMA
ncbi:ppGpp synthase/hydrolase RelA [Seminavis robusta]|uniref:PpGpp synthase/hydrolase RelA n=1 Tax=Seminavis robusta TaxID=568900 RepID=A0A9N8H7D3_9STRA|nr:ppGpp synthase/hydrolase RelA [Seminavis robusta]|eukprot:Sro138_g064590.1 ppGpp synthase/hydrolase RelA (757) ;mRNA; f:5289-8026